MAARRESIKKSWTTEWMRMMSRSSARRCEEDLEELDAWGLRSCSERLMRA